jgi:hypothetical protein
MKKTPWPKNPIANQIVSVMVIEKDPELPR